MGYGALVGKADAGVRGNADADDLSNLEDILRQLSAKKGGGITTGGEGKTT